MYLKKKTLADEYDISVRTVDAQIRFLRPYIGQRYPRDSITRTGRIVRVRDDVFRDVMVNRDLIETGIAPEFVPGERHSWERRLHEE